MEDTQKVSKNRGHNGKCIYCQHGPYCLTCPPPESATGPVCGNCREEVTRSEIAADPYYRDDYSEMFG